eukprot:RCo049023
MSSRQIQDERVWVVCTRAEDLPVFLQTYPPSHTSLREIEWISVRRSAEEARGPSGPLSLAQALSQWKKLPVCQRTNAKANELALETGELTGKWLVFASPESVNAIWAAVASAVFEGRLGPMAKVSPAMESASEGLSARAREQVKVLICVYTCDYTNEGDVRRVREQLRALGVRERLKYKTDMLTHLDVYAANRNEHNAKTFVYEL